MISLILKELAIQLPDDIYLKLKSDLDEANIEVKSVSISSDYKNPLSDQYSSKGGSYTIEYSINTDNLAILQILSAANKINHYLSFMVDGVISAKEYKEQKKLIITKLVNVINKYYGEKGKPQNFHFEIILSREGDGVCVCFQVYVQVCLCVCVRVWTP